MWSSEELLLRQHEGASYGHPPDDQLRRPSSSHRLRRLLLALASATLATLFFAKSASAGGWIFYDSDQVSKGQCSLNLTGTINHYYASDNSNHRYVTMSIRAYQSTRQYKSMCIGIKVMFRTETTSSTRGGAVSGGWSLTGPSASATASYSQTRQGGSTSDGFSWTCPRNGQTYVTQRADGGRPFHPLMEGKLTHV